MDIATVVGLVLGTILILVAILLGGSIVLFINIPSVMIVAGGTFATVMIRFGLGDVINATKVAMNAFFTKTSNPGHVIKEIVNLANIARKTV